MRLEPVLGLVGVSIGFLVAIFSLTGTRAWGTGLEIWGLTIIPALTGFVVGAAIRGSMRGIITSLGTGMGWVLFLALLLFRLPGSSFAFGDIVFQSAIVGPVWIVLPGAILWAVIRVAERGFTWVGGRLLESPPDPGEGAG